MSDINEVEVDKPFALEKAITGRAKCKKCKCIIEKDTIRIAKLMNNPFGEGKMKAWHHVTCLFDVFAKQRLTTKRIDDPDEDIDGWDQLDSGEKKYILDKITEFENNLPYKKKRSASSGCATPAQKIIKRSPSATNSRCSVEIIVSNEEENDKILTNRDNAFREFRRICAAVANVSSYTDKTAIVKKMFTTGCDGDIFKGNIIQWCKMLLPMANKMIYNLQSKQLVKLFARILQQNEDEMLKHLEQGDVAETIRNFFEKNTTIKRCNKSLLSLHEVYVFLIHLSHQTKEDEQILHFKSIIPRCTPNDLKMIIRLIKHDLRINCGPKHILQAISPDAYHAYQLSHDLDTVLKRFTDQTSKCTIIDDTCQNASQNKVSISLMTPVFPMLAEACTSVEIAMKKCPNGMLSEVKYDGERVQVHKHDSEFRYFSRSLKPVLPHKVNHFKNYIPKAFPDGDDLILDSEILMIDTRTDQPLPFGTLGVHKKAEFKDANVCIIIFDCLYYNGDILLNRTMKQRREILKQHMNTIPRRVILSEAQEVHNSKDLAEMIAKVLKMGLEGLVLKDINSLYEPGKRHWLKIKKDYLFGGAIADSADLVVLGAWYGTGNKGGMMSIFLMGCYDEDADKWVTVTKVHSGHDDAMLDRLQNELNMVKLGKNSNAIPNWLRINKPMIPDFIAVDPKMQPVWEITGAEFTNQGSHTADGISIRFPRVTRIRDDKDWSTATSLKELKKLFQTNSESIDVSLLLNTSGTDSKINKRSPKKKNTSHDSDVNNDKKNLLGKYVASENQQYDEQITENENFVKNKNSAEYYAFIENDYIEYSSDGNSLNWIEGHKPKKGLPHNAMPISRSGQSNPKAKGILGGIDVALSNDIMPERKTVLSKNLLTLGAKVHLEGSIKPGVNITHVIHGTREITENELRKWKFVGIRHVSESWIDSTIALSMKQDEYIHAVNLRGSYCNCKCSHH